MVTKDHETLALRGLDPNDPKYGLFYQMTRLTRERGALIQDDRLDALAGAVQWHQVHMAANPEKAVEKRKEKALMEELKRFKRNVHGRSVNAGRGRPKGLRRAARHP